MFNSLKEIDNALDIRFNSVDLFYAFCEAKGIDDPECGLTDEEYNKLEEEFENKVKFKDLWDLNAAIIADGMKRIYCAMSEVAKR